MSETSLYQPISGLDLLRRIRIDPGKRTATAMAALERIERIDSRLGAMTAVARRETVVAASSSANGPLAGLPVAVKDIFDTDDLITSYGSPIYEGYQPRSDSAIVTLLRRNGGTIVGKTATSEFAYMAPNFTRNPCDVSRTAGGSSAGSAAAVAAGIVPFAIGSQTGGSTIRPASFCGVAGFKPSFDLLPTSGMKTFAWSLDTVGLFAAGVRDAAYLAQVLSGRRLAVADLPTQPVFGVPDAYPWTPPSDNAMAAMDVATKAIERAGGVVRRVSFEPWMAELVDAHAIIQSFEAYQTLGYEYDHHRGELSSTLRDFLDQARTIDAVTYAEACDLRDRAKGRAEALFEGIDALLTPSAPDEAPSGFDSTGDPAFNRNWTLLGNPCVNVPGLIGARGCPIGIQVIGRLGADAQSLAAAAFVELALATQP